MDFKPLITIKGTSDLTLGQAHKLIKKFHATCVSSSSVSTSAFNINKQDVGLGEDTVDKLATLVEEIKRRAEVAGEKLYSAPSPSLAFTPAKGTSTGETKSHGKEKKRKREKSEELETKGKEVEGSEKKKKKSKKSDK